MLKEIKEFITRTRSVKPTKDLLFLDDAVFFNDGVVAWGDNELMVVVRDDCFNGLKGIVSMSTLVKLTKGASSLDISIDEDTMDVHISTETLNVDLQGRIQDWEDCDKFLSPIINAKRSGLTCTIDDGKKLKVAADYVSSDELRLAMNFVYIDNERIAATDAHRLYYMPHGCTGIKEDQHVFVHKKIAQKLLSDAVVVQTAIVKGRSGSTQRDYTFVTQGGTEYICHMPDARFPDYMAVVPKESDLKNEMSFNKKKMLDALKKLDAVANPTTHLMEVNIGLNGKDFVLAEDLDMGTEGKFTLDKVDAKVKTEGIRIGLNINILASVLNTMPGDTITMKMSTPTRAVIINDCALAMPVMLST